MTLQRVNGRAWLRYIVAVLAVALASVVRAGFLAALGTRAPFVTFYPAVILAALYGGFPGGLLATFLSAGVTAFFWMDPVGRLSIQDPADWLAMVVFLVSGAMISGTCEAMHRAQARASQAEAQARLAVERQQAAEEIRRISERLELATLAAGAGVWSWTPGTSDVIVSAIWRRLFGIGLDIPVTFETWRCALHPDDRDRVVTELNTACEQHREFKTEYRAVWPDGAVHWLVDHGRASYDKGGRAVSMSGVNMDITERKHAQGRIEQFYQEAQQELARRQQLELELRRSNEDLGQFAFVVSHDLRSPLTAVAGFAQQLEEDYQGKLGADADVYISYITGAAELMRRMISDLLAYSRVAHGELSEFGPVDATEVLESTRLTLDGRIRESHAVITYGPLPQVVGNFSLLAQLFQNLIENAVKYSRKEEPPRIHVSAERQAGEWMFCVSDNGMGIDPKYAEQAFRLFKRLHGDQYEGTGIGLAICKKIVERHRGRIWVESMPGQGARFYLTLPAPMPARQEAPQ